MGYAYAYDKSGKLMRSLGARGYPSAALIGPRGDVLWTGHPSKLKANMIAKHLTGTLPRPLFEYPKDQRKVASTLLKSDFDGALKSAEKVGGECFAETSHYIDELISVASEAQLMGDYLTAESLAKDLAKGLGRHELAADAKAILDELKADKEVQRVIKGQKMVKTLTMQLAEANKKKSEQILKMLGKIEKDFAGTRAGHDAADLMSKAAAAAR